MAALIPYVANPLIDLVRPAYEDFSAPFYAAHRDIYVPLHDLFTGKDYQSLATLTRTGTKEKYEKLLLSITRIVASFALFHAYQKAWETGVDYFGVAGALAGFVICLSAGNAIDNRSNDMGRSAWFLFRGVITLLKNFGDSRAALLCLILIRERKDKKEEGLFGSPWMKASIASVADRVVAWSYRPPTAGREGEQLPPRPVKPSEAAK